MVLAAETNLQKLLEGTKQYQVPLYQRTYSWKVVQLSRLWDDLLKLADDRRERGQAATHFIGSMVLAPSPSVSPTGVQVFLVVDGQQRLTALTLLLTAIRDHRAETEDPDHTQRVNDKYLINRWEDGQPLKLQPTQADRNSYFACVRGTHDAGGDDPVGAAYRFFRARLIESDDPDDDLDIQRLEEAVVAGLSIVCVTAQDADNVHRIFESLNNTGLRLTQSDLIRNYLFMRLPTRGDDVYQTHWLPLQDRLSSPQLELLFWLDLVQEDESAKQTDTYALQKARLDRIGDEAGIEAEVERFARLGSLLEVILDPAKESDRDVRRRLGRLNQWGTTTVYPILLHLFDRRARGTASGDDLIEAMRYLESFFVRRIVIGRATANINRVLLRAVAEIRDQSPVPDALRDYLSTGRKYFASDADVRSAVRTVPFYWQGRAAQRRLILLWLEESYGSKEPVVPADLSIEHVIPQTPTEAWREGLAADLEPGEDPELAYQALIHTVGNLTLTGYNAELSNSPFATKKVHLASSGLRMNQEIAGSPTWSRPDVLARADRLGERIIELWPGPNPSAAEAASVAVWSNLNEVLAQIPAGNWTTYGDVAAAIGTHPVPLGQRLANYPAPNAHRVLNAGGVVAKNFRWLEPERAESAQGVLEDEGVTFDESGRAKPDQRLDARALARLAGLETDDEDPTLAAVSSSDLRNAFLSQLQSHQADEVVKGVEATIEAWVHLGGQLTFGSGQQTSCFLLTKQTTRGPWPFAIYPADKIEVVFQHLANRPPFDDVELRDQFRRRLNTVSGIDLPASKLERRPSFPIETLANVEARDAIINELAWFIAICGRDVRGNGSG